MIKKTDFVLFAVLFCIPGISYSFEAVDLDRIKDTGDCSRCDLRNADLSGMDLNNAILTYSNFSNANLSNTQLNGADLRRSNFDRANFSNAEMVSADMRKSSFKEAVFL